MATNETELPGFELPVPPPELAAAHSSVRREYGSDPDQHTQWRVPTGSPQAVAVLVHGGFYRSRWTASLMDALAVDLAEHGWVSVNLEYRRPDRHSWGATVTDLVTAILQIYDTAEGLPVVLFGHSAGGQLVLQASETLASEGRALVPRLAVSLAGIVDLAAAHEQRLDSDAVNHALGGSPAEYPERYAAASPIEFLERRTNWLLVQGSDDAIELVEANRRLAAQERLGYPELIDAPGDHFSVIDPKSDIWRVTIARVEQLLAEAT